MQTHTSSEKCDKETRDCLTMNHKLKHLIRYTQFFSIYLPRYSWNWNYNWSHELCNHRSMSQMQNMNILLCLENPSSITPPLSDISTLIPLCAFCFCFLILQFPSHLFFSSSLFSSSPSTCSVWLAFISSYMSSTTPSLLLHFPFHSILPWQWQGWRLEGSKDVSRNACWNKSKIAGLLPLCLLSFSTIF